MKSIILGLIIITITTRLSAQLAIEDCYLKARQNYPLISQAELIEKSKEYTLSNANKSYLPQLFLSAKASYQSDVTEIPIEIPGVKGMNKDQYSITMDVQQIIWDGGTTKTTKDVYKKTADIELKQLEVDIYSINNQINQLFFGILLIDAKIQQNTIYQKELQRSYDLIDSYISNGIANKSDLDIIKLEQIKSKQNLSQLENTRKAYLNMLSTLTGEKFNDDISLIKPNINQPVSREINRPEIELFKAQKEYFDAQKNMLNHNNNPKLSIFFTGGYGNPGLNMLKSDFALYYIGGIRFAWNIGKLYTKNDEKRIIDVNQNKVQNKKETFLFNIEIDSKLKSEEIKSKKDLLKYDDEIINLRNSIKNTTQEKVANGTLTSLDLIREINAEDLAIQDKLHHEIELLLSIYNLKFTTNN